MTTILVHLNARGALDWKPADVKGARWHSNIPTLEAVMDDATKAGVPYPREIDYVDFQERAS